MGCALGSVAREAGGCRLEAASAWCQGGAWMMQRWEPRRGGWSRVRCGAWGGREANGNRFDRERVTSRGLNSRAGPAAGAD